MAYFGFGACQLLNLCLSAFFTHTEKVVFVFLQQYFPDFFLSFEKMSLTKQTDISFFGFQV